AKSGEVLLPIQDDFSISTATWSPDESKILTRSGGGRVHIWDVQSDSFVLTQFTYNLGNSPYIRDNATWSPDGTRILALGGDGIARLLNAQNGEILFSLPGNSISFAEWNPDGTQILTGSTDGNIYLWDAQNGDKLMSLYGHKDQIEHAEWSPDGSQIVTRSADKTVRTWYVNMDDLVSAVCRKLPRNLTWDEWQQYMEEAYRPTCLEAPIPPDAIEAVTEEAQSRAQNGDLAAAAERLAELVGWLRENGQFNTFGIEREEWLAKLQAGANPWAEE
ncbi:MAG: hypothetical protein H6645_00070, partial [Caldilineaceae bacterium]|nr:hypothetical protein [Caldilineaceae bacterium]